MEHKILIADDSQTIQKVIRITLASEPFQIEECINPLKLKESLEGANPDIVVLDFNFSDDKTGYQLALEIYEFNPLIKIIMLFGTFDTIDENKLELHHVSGKMIKPFDGGKFINLCKSLISAEVQEKAEPQDFPKEITDWEMSVPSIIGEEDSKEALLDIPDVIEESGFELPSSEDLDYPEVEPIQDIKEFIKDEMSSDDFWSPDEVSSFEPEIEPIEINTDVVIDFEIEQEPESEAEVTLGTKSIIENPLQEEALLSSLFERIKPLLDEKIKKYCHEQVSKVAWEVIPDLAENIIKEELSKIADEVLDSN